MKKLNKIGNLIKTRNLGQNFKNFNNKKRSSFAVAVEIVMRTPESVTLPNLKVKKALV
jgi:hypothetical protein